MIVAVYVFGLLPCLCGGGAFHCLASQPLDAVADDARSIYPKHPILSLVYYSHSRSIDQCRTHNTTATADIPTRGSGATARIGSHDLVHLMGQSGKRVGLMEGGPTPIIHHPSHPTPTNPPPNYPPNIQVPRGAANPNPPRYQAALEELEALKQQAECVRFGLLGALVGCVCVCVCACVCVCVCV